ncbi:MAG: N-acetylglucosamine-6-phosphate deacetylase, partial [Paenibacillus sp.]|nr:N-acetylglucosamine-6-phosphate deacetylase [Paenibacillus sp.]
DGFHLPESVIKVMLRTKGDKVIVTSDASFISGLLPGEYSTDIGGHVTLTSEGRLHLSHNPQLLAGSAQMQIKAIEHLTNSKLANLTTAWDMCSVRPAHLLGLSTRNGLEEGAPADMVVFRRHDANIRVLRTYKNGRLVYENKML